MRAISACPSRPRCFLNDVRATGRNDVTSANDWSYIVSPASASSGMCVPDGPGVPVIGVTATWPRRLFNELTLMTTAGELPKSKLTSQTCPRDGSGAVIGRSHAERQRWSRLAVEVVHGLRHALLGGLSMQEAQGGLDDVSTTVETEHLGIGP